MKLYLDIDGVLLHTKYARVPECNVIERLESIKPTTYDVLKTDAICFDEDFYWLNGSPFNAELAVLKQHGCERRCIVVNLSCQDELRRIKLMLEDCVSFVVK